jgi:hypothetical protein
VRPRPPAGRATEAERPARKSVPLYHKGPRPPPIPQGLQGARHRLTAIRGGRNLRAVPAPGKCPALRGPSGSPSALDRTLTEEV